MNVKLLESLGNGVGRRGGALALFTSHSFRVAFGQYGLLCVISAIVIGYLSYRSTIVVDRQLLQTIEAEVEGLSEQYRQSGLSGLARVVKSRSDQPGNSLYVLANGDRRVIAGNMSTVTSDLWNAVGDVDFTYKAGSVDGRERAATGVVFRLPGDTRLIVGRDVEDQIALKRLFRHTVIWAAGAILFVGIGVGSLVSFRSRRRIDEAIHTSRRIMEGDLSERLRADYGDDEFNRLAGSVNEMLGRIEHLVKSYRQFSDDVAHDLKTPLTRMRAQAEHALTAASDNAEAREAFGKVIDDADSLLATFTAILRISRLEMKAGGHDFETVDVSELVSEMCEFYAPLLEDDGWEFDYRKIEQVNLPCDSDLIRRSVSNLIENALKYGHREEKRLSVSLTQVGETVELEIADRGPGIAQSDRARVLERFVRLDPDRSRPGNGLGLSLVAAVAKYHQAALLLEDNNPGLRVSLRLKGQAQPVREIPTVRPPVRARRTSKSNVWGAARPAPAVTLDAD